MVLRLFMGLCLAAGLAVTTIQAQIPGRNINMVSGTTWPNGDPFLQRQNEPSIAASTRNPLHLLAGANDYRSVDLPGLPGDETGDAWLGLFKSYDGGQRWNSTLLPGYPQDTSVVGLASPIHGYSAGADPVVRAGTSGLIYYAGLVFDRSPAGSDVPGKSAIFVSRFIDNNNNEGGDPFKFLGTRALATDPGGSTGNFLDKPWLAVDIPRDTTRCTITTPGEPQKPDIVQNLPAGPVYVAYTLRSTDGQGPRYDVYFTASGDCGSTWAKPVRLNNATERANQGATMAIDPRNGDVHIAWRQFDLKGDNDAVMAVKFTRATKKVGTPKAAHKPKRDKTNKKAKIDPDKFFKKGGLTKAVEAANLSPLDQATSDIAGLLAFRTNAYPSLTVDDTGRAYLAWAERGYEPLSPDPVSGNARVLVASSGDGASWTPAQPVAVEGQAGHQLMPTITFAGGKLMLVYYDLRETRSEVLLSPYIDDATALAGVKQRRHTIDLRASMGTPGAAPVFAPSVRVSEYLMGAGADGVVRQLQVNPPNLPMFKQGTAPFMGDYVDVTAAPAFVVDAAGKWTYNTQATGTPPVFHAAWTDNRDVRPPLEDPPVNGVRDGNPWNNYTPPGALGNLASIVDPTQLVGQCIPGNAGSRNQNIYTARITGGLLAGSPGNTKTLSTDFQRAFVVFVQNTTPYVANSLTNPRTRTFRLTIANQPPGGRASFSQFPIPPYTTSSVPPLTTIDTVVPALSTSSRTVYVTSSDPHARLNITVAEVESVGGALKSGGLGSVVVLNPDIDNPDIDNPDIDNPDIDNPDIDNPDIDNAEVYNPDIDNPDIDNPDIDNPDIDNPDIDNPDIDNVVVANPDIDNPDIDNPDIDNGNLLNPDIDNPDIDNPDIDNPDIDNASLTDISWTITNEGNTTASYNVNLFFAQTTIKPELTTQLILYRTYRTPVVVNCELKYETRNVLVANVPNPELVKSSTGEVSDPNDPEATNATIWLAPGESAKITLRVMDLDASDSVTVTNPDGTTAKIDPTLVPNEDVTPVVQQQSVDTLKAAAGETEPPVVVQFPAPQTVPDAAATAPNTPVTFNVLANDSTAFGSTKVISLHPANMAAHSGGGPGDIAFQSSTGFLYTQRGIVDPATDALVGRLPLPPPGTLGIIYQVANHRTGINYGRTALAGGGLTALDARPGSDTFHEYLTMPAIADSVFSFGIDAAHHRLYVVHGPNSGPATTTLSVIDINPANQLTTFHTVLSSVALPGNVRGQAVAVNTRTQKVYVTASNAGGGVFVFDGTQQPLQAPVKVAGTTAAWSVLVNEAANLAYASTFVNGSFFGLYVIDGATNALATVPTAELMRTSSPEERLALHIPTGRVLMRLETSVVIIDTQRGSPNRNTVVGTPIGVGRENGGVDIVVDQELGLAVTAGSYDFQADIIDIEAGALTETIFLKAGPTDVDIDPVNHRAFVAVPLTYVQEIDLVQQEATAEVEVYIESGGMVVNPVRNRAYAGILGVGGSLGVVSGSGFNGTIAGLNPESRFLFSTRYDANDRYFIVNQGNPDGTSYGPGMVVSINGATDLLADEVATLPNPFGIGVNQFTGKLYVASLSSPGLHGGINVFDANDLGGIAPVQATPAAGFPLNNNTPNTAFLGFGRHVVVNASVANPNSGKVYAMQIGGSPTSLVVIDPVNNIITPLDGLATALPGGLPAGTPLPAPGSGAPGLWGRVEVIRAAPALNRVYLGMYDSVSNTNRIVALDGTTDQVIGSWIGGRHSNRHTASYLIVNEATNRLYVTNYDTDTLTMLDATTLSPVVTPGAPLGEITLPDGPSALAFNYTSNRLYVSSINAKTLTAVDGATLAIQSSVKMPLVAYFLYVDEIESRLYTSGGDSSDESGIMVITDVLGQLGTNVGVTSITQPDHGVAILDPVDYSITYTPDADYAGPDSFGYTITAPTGSANGVVNITVVPANPRSVSFVDGYTTGMNQPLTVPAPGVLANDATGDPAATVVFNDTTQHGDLTTQPDGSFSYQPDPGFVGMDEFEYHTVGLLGVSNTTKVGIIVTAATNLVVTTTLDSGAGSLRQAMSTANLEPGSVIAFDIPGAGPHTIQPNSALPTMNAPVTIDGYTQPGAVANSAAVGTNAQLKIILRGASAGGGSGLNLRGGSSTVRGLVINGFASGSGILLDGTLGNNTVEGNFLGTDVTGSNAAANQYGVSSQSPDNTIGGTSLASRNLISGNTNQGVRAVASTSGSGAATVVLNAGDRTTIKNNLVGTRATGMTALPNGGGISLSVPDVVIGGTSAAERNIVSGNTGIGISASANVSSGFVVSRPDRLTVQGNYIGTTAAGTAALANSSTGITSSGDTTIIGGSNPTPLAGCAGACNLISGNGNHGVLLNNTYDSVTTSPTVGTIYSSAANSRVEGNYIGVNLAGDAAIPNSSQGIQLTAPGITVGGGTAATRNVISGNNNGGSSGINVTSITVTNSVTGPGFFVPAGTGIVVNTGTGAVVRGNYIGLNAAGTAALPNGNGINVSVPDVTIGGIVAGDRNVISGNTQSGITTGASVFAPAGFPIAVLTTPARLIVKGNYIGVSADAATAVANSGSGLYVSGPDSVIGGTENMSPLSCTGACNLISGNTNGGSGATALNVSSQFNNTAGPTLGTLYSSASGTQVLGNFIGVNVTGTAAIPNNYGVNVNAANVIVGGAAAGARNVVSGNLSTGIGVGTSWVSSNTPVASGTGTRIKGNIVGLTADGTARLANGNCGICSNAAGVIIGGPGLNEGNRVAGAASSTGINLGRQTNGTFLVDAGGTTTVEGNIVGLSTTSARLDGGTGIYVSSANNTIRGNIVAGNGALPVYASGISLSTASASGNVVVGNTVGTNAAGAAGLGNTGGGIAIFEASNNTIGGVAPGDRNTIAGNSGPGVSVNTNANGAVASGNVIVGNYIGVLADGTSALPNNSGVNFYANGTGSITGNVVGGNAAAARNVVSGNTGSGVSFGGAGTTGNQVAGNYIGTTASGLAPLPNTSAGIYTNAGSGNTFGGANPGEGNLIAYNNGPGIAVQSPSVGNRILGNVIRENASLAIDLEWNGATANDNGDADGGGNSQQNYPLLLSAATTPGLTTAVQADLSSFANGSYTLQFFASTQCDANGNSRGEQLVGSFAGINAGGVTTLDLSPAVAAGQYITATATDAAGNTSELSTCFIQADVVPTEVTNTNNSGSGSLRNALTYANATPGAQTITFNIPGAGPHTIQPTSMLPIIQGPVVIDGYTQPGATPNTLATGGTNAALKIVVNGANAAGAWAGLSVGSGGATIRGLVINGFSANNGHGILVDNPTGTSVVAGNFLGTDATGMVAVPNGWGVVTHSPNSVIGGSAPADRNLLSGNTQSGAQVSASTNGATVYYTASGSSVRNNLVGTNATGNAALANQRSGIEVSVPGVSIGSADPADRNVVSGNIQTGISAYAWTFADAPVTVPSGLRIEGNYVGTNAGGTAAVPNGGGISVTGANSIIGGTTGTTPGGACTGACNLISGNNFSGLMLTNTYNYNTGTVHSSASNSVVTGNYIGVDVTGMAAVPNTSNGVDITASTVTVGGDTPAARNLVAGNGSAGVSVAVNYTATFAPLAVTGAGSVIRGNFLGVNAAGTAALGTAQYGVISSASNVTIGGPNLADRNVIVGGVLLNRLMNGATVISAGGTNTVQGNHIGVDLGGTIRMNSSSTGVWVGTATNQIIGNVIAGLGVPGPVPVYAAGVMLSGAPATGNSVKGNYIGTNAAGAAGLENTGEGVAINDASGNTIGGTAPGDRNVISGNSNGVGIYANNGGTANGNVVAGNYIGVKPDGVTALPNGIGVMLSHTGTGVVSNTVIGGAAAGARNVIAGNTSNGIGVYGTGTTATTIAGNYIGMAADSATDRGNAFAGIWISDSANNTVGGSNAGEANVIAFNDQTGVGVQNLTALGNRISGNRIFSNGSTGIDLVNGGNNNQGAPVLANAANIGPATTVDADLSALAPGAYTVEFFQGSACGQGDTFVSRFVNVPQGSAAPFTLTQLVPEGRWLTATATDAAGNTSSFSACVQVVANPLIVTNTNDTGAGSLRNAMTYANSAAGTQTISFNISGAISPATPAVIAPVTALPTISGPVVIDGTTQPGYTPGAPVVELTGSGIGGYTTGLTITAGSSTVRGLSVTGFTANGISLQGGTLSVIEDNWIGVRPTGVAQGNGSAGAMGIYITSSGSNTIARNVIAASGDAGVHIYSAANNNSVQNNKIGTAPDGLSAMANVRGVVLEGSGGTTRPTGNIINANLIAGNTQAAIQFACGMGCGGVGTFITDNTIGLKPDDSLLANGTGILVLDGPGTVISGNRIAGGTTGISISESAPIATTAIEIKANKIGTDSTGFLARPTGTGILVAASAVTIPVLVGGSLPGEGNRIAFNTGIGVNILGTAVTVKANSIEANGGLGIDKGAPGPTAPFPAVSSAANLGGNTAVSVDLSFLAVGVYAVDFFASVTCDASNHGEGERLVGSANLTQPGGNASLNEVVPVGQFITVTATDAAGSTSEFSACVPVSEPSTVVTNINDTGAGSLRDAITNSNTMPGTQTISFNIPGASAASPAVITVAAGFPLPVIMSPVVIDGSTDPGWDGLPVVEVSGAGLVTNGFETTVDISGVQIKNLSITGFTNAGIMLMQAETLGGHTISGNYLGTDRFGNAGKGNLTGVVVRSDSSSINNNVISGNTVGVRLENDADSVVISTNKIGMMQDGLTPRPNSQAGIRMFDSLNNNIILNNMISKNGGWGIDVQDSLAGDVRGTMIYGNIIGLDANGNIAGNFGGGVRLENAPATDLGMPGAAVNVISGNGGPNPPEIGVGVQVIGPGAVNIRNNYIGLDPTGVFARSNNNKGIVLDGVAQVGGNNANERNYISGNGDAAGGAGIVINPTVPNGTVIAGNVIGLNVNDQAVPNGYAGITVRSISMVTIGGFANAANVISGNGSYGISVIRATNGDPYPMGTVIQKNIIGADSTGAQPRANGTGGIYAGGNNLQIGAWNGGNQIKFNGGVGIRVPAGMTGVRMETNVIEANAGIGIDLGIDGPTANDPGDTDAGANDLQNFLTVTSASNAGGGNTFATVDTNEIVAGTYLVEFFKSQTCDPTGYGEGAQSLIRFGITAQTGVAQLNLNSQVPAGWFVTTLVTSDATNNTSEFSPCQVVTAPPPPATIVSATTPVAPGAGQMIWLTGSNLPGAGPADIIIKSGTTDYPAQYTWTAGSSLVIARFIAAIPTGPATIRVQHSSGSPVSNEFPITIATTPSAPVATAVYGGSCGGFAGAITSTTQGGGVVVGAKGIDTTGVKFKWTPLNGGSPQSIAAGASCGGPNNDVHVQSTVPLAYGPGTVLKLEITTTVNGVESPVSNPFTLVVEDTGATLAGSVSSGSDPGFPAMTATVGGATTRISGNYNVAGISLVAAYRSLLEYPMFTTGEQQYGAAGFAGSDTPFSMACPAGSVFTGLTGTHSSANAINSLGAECKAVDALAGGVTATTGPFGPPGTTSFSISCPAGKKMVGFEGQAGGHISGLGIICR